jgi:nicotinate-nucleotide pyrophosphorylase (carboxylating)
LLDTRKTLPGYRVLQKYAVAVAGGWNHRFGLYDRVLFKDNHWALLQQHGTPLSAVLQHYRLHYPCALVQVEVDTIDQLQQALAAGTDGVLLDNFTPEALQEAVAQINKATHPVWTEVSGNLTPSHLAQLQTLGLHGVACGRIIHQAQWVDIGLDAL